MKEQGGAASTVFVDRLVLACGGPAGDRLGQSDFGFRTLRALGVPVTRYQPALVPLETDQDGKKLFDVGMGWDNKEAGAELIESVNFNGKAIPFDERFYFCVEPYLTESHYIPGFCWAGRDGESWIKETQTDPNA